VVEIAPGGDDVASFEGVAEPTIACQPRWEYALPARAMPLFTLHELDVEKIMKPILVVGLAAALATGVASGKECKGVTFPDQVAGSRTFMRST
jgi:hypothetical protein